MKKEETMKVTSTDELQKVRNAFSGEVVELPPFGDGQRFIAKLKRISLLELAKSGIIPNPLLGAVQEIYEGRQRADIKKYAEVLDIVCSKALIEPAYDTVKDILIDAQKVAILAYSQHGVAGLLPFRALAELQEDSNSSKK
jgi:hypothetical protein